MKGAKEFTGRSLDDAIAAACNYYDLPREKLEVEIINDAKTGIFGLVGAKKATILAKQASVKNFDFESKEEKKQEHSKPSAKNAEIPDRPDHQDRQAKPRNRPLSEAAQGADAPLETGAEKSSSTQMLDKKESTDNSLSSEAQTISDRSDRSSRNPRPRQPSQQQARDKRDEKDAPREGRNDRRGRRFNGNADSANTSSDTNGNSAGNTQAHDRRPDERNNDRSDRNDRNDRNGRNAPRDRNRSPREAGDNRRNDSRRQTRDRQNPAAPKLGNSLDFSDAEAQNQFINSSEGNYSESNPYLAARQQVFEAGNNHQFAEQIDHNSAWAPASSSNNEYMQPNHLVNNYDADAQFNDDQADDFEPSQATQNFANLDKEKACELVKASLDKMVAAICSDADISVNVGEGRITASIDCGEASGLLIGREGQTLSALQYMVSRIISRQMEAAVHVHLDTGDYKERQDRKLEEISLRLAQRARETGRTQYTRPLSSYHRRIVHMVLQAEQGIETRSKGEGSMKRVYIFTRSN